MDCLLAEDGPLEEEEEEERREEEEEEEEGGGEVSGFSMSAMRKIRENTHFRPLWTKNIYCTPIHSPHHTPSPP